MLIEPRSIKLTTRTGVEVRRTLPHAAKRMIGAWCFIDHFGPTPQTDAMVVAAHPHTGLQTVTWLIEGAIEHRDSIGSVQRIEPGQLNLMTAGRGIAHSELSLAGPERLHAVQLWVALPKVSIDVAPAFEHQANLPKLAGAGFSATVLVGSFMGVTAETKIFSPMMGAEIRIPANQTVTLDLEQDFEYGVLVVEGTAIIATNRDPSLTTQVPTSALFVVETGHSSVTISSGDAGLVLLLLGGEPFVEKILMWWNFIGRTHDDIVRDRNDWNNHLELAESAERWPEFEDHIGGWIPAPELPNLILQPR